LAGAAPTAVPWTPPDQRSYDRRWQVLAVLCTSLVVVIVGNTSLNVAIPTIQRELQASQTALQWMVDSYGLIFAGLLLSAGAIGDRFGRKGALQAGLAIFFVGSLLAGVLESTGAIIALRAVMGLGAAFVMPGTLSILANVFPPHERGKAIAIWAGLSAAGAGIGPIASGYLLNHYSYGSVFFVNLPIIALALVSGHYLLPKSRDPGHTRLDPVGAVLSIVGLVAIVYALIEAPTHGWGSPETILTALAGLAVLGVFAWWELHTDHPMLDLRYFKNPRFSMAAGGVTLVFFTMFGMFFLITLYFQLVLGYSPLGAGLRNIPIVLAIMLTAPNSARLTDRFGAKLTVAGGLALVGIGQLLLLTTKVDTPYLFIALSMMVVASGMGISMAPLTASIMGAVPLGKAGVGSAVNDTTRELGGALGVAVLGSLLQSTYSGKVADLVTVPEGARELAQTSLGGAFRAAEGLDPATARVLVDGAKQAYVSGMHLALVVAASVAIVTVGLVLRYLPGKDDAPSPALAGAHERRPLEPEAA
jgi:EmrB/QacA subfamily drug resistance transporter